MALSRENSGWRFLSRASPNKKKKDLEQLLQTTPSFPGIPLHVATPDDVTREEIDEVEVSFPVHIRNSKLIKVSELDHVFCDYLGPCVDVLCRKRQRRNGLCYLMKS